MRATIPLVAALALTGCGGGEKRVSTTTPSKVAIAQATGEYPSPTPRQSATGGDAAPIRALRRFAETYINWSADDVASRMHSLAGRCVGQARSAMELAASQTAGDYELQRGGVSNSGTVEAIARLAGKEHRYVVVTREQTSATATTEYQGLRPAWHVSIATLVELTPGRWVVSVWQPEN